MTEQSDQLPADWASATYEGARREQLRRWSRLPLAQVIAALEEMEQLSIRLGTLPGTPPPASPGSSK